MTIVDDETGVSIEFNEILGAGITTITTSTTPPNPHIGFKLGGHYYYDIVTTATYSSPITIGLPYDENPHESNLKLTHWVDGVGWVDVTTWIDSKGRPVLEMSLGGIIISALESKTIAQRYLTQAAINKDETLLDFSLIG